MLVPWANKMFRHLDKEKLTCPSEIARCEIVGAVIIKVVDEPAVAQWAVCHVGYPEFPRGIDETISLVDRFERRIFSLESINLRDCGSCQQLHLPCRMHHVLTGVCLSERCGRAFRKADVFGLALLPNLVERTNRFLERSF